MPQYPIPLIDLENLRTYLPQQSQTTFKVMLRMAIQPLAAGQEIPPPTKQMVGVVSFAGGKLSGNVALTVSPEYARIMAAALLGFEPGEAMEQCVVNDVLGEITNMICGHLVGWLAERSFSTELSPPTVAFSPKVHFQTSPEAFYESYPFADGTHPILLELQLRAKPTSAA